MKTTTYAFLLLCLPGCRLSQPLLFVDTNSKVAITSTAAPDTSLAVGTAAIIITTLSPAASPKQAPTLLRRTALQQPRKAETSPSVYYTPLTKARKFRQFTSPFPSGVATDRSTITPGKSLILAGIGAIMILISALTIPSIATFEGAILLAFILVSGVVFLLFGLFSYLLGLYEKGRVARAARPKK